MIVFIFLRDIEAVYTVDLVNVASEMDSSITSIYLNTLPLWVTTNILFITSSVNLAISVKFYQIFVD